MRGAFFRIGEEGPKKAENSVIPSGDDLVPEGRPRDTTMTFPGQRDWVPQLRPHSGTGQTI
ncbi:MAG: hypothetical protein N0A16_05500 [Blastocatellia bacterium]|nr:hypothetical protein [Blastocatellia bacterium]MCS7157164.1 hypothetical protein [Blastocatellia bacterium]MCX7752373.1 hypothetical protein [Blastocatellia bacterium]MDW8167254.1 hypothetical protein [Acidobacteriota bacterium]